MRSNMGEQRITRWRSYQRVEIRGGLWEARGCWGTVSVGSFSGKTCEIALQKSQGKRPKQRPRSLKQAELLDDGCVTYGISHLLCLLVGQVWPLLDTVTELHTRAEMRC